MNCTVFMAAGGIDILVEAVHTFVAGLPLFLFLDGVSGLTLWLLWKEERQRPPMSNHTP